MLKDLFYSFVWYVTKLYTYGVEYSSAFIRFIKNKTKNKNNPQYSEINADDVDDIIICDAPSLDNEREINFDFIIIQIEYNSKTYDINNWKQYIDSDNKFLTNDIIHQILIDLNAVDKNAFFESEYHVSIIDDQSNIIALNKNQYLTINKDNYDIVNIF